MERGTNHKQTNEHQAMTRMSAYLSYISIDCIIRADLVAECPELSRMSPVYYTAVTNEAFDHLRITIYNISPPSLILVLSFLSLCHCDAAALPYPRIYVARYLY